MFSTAGRTPVLITNHSFSETNVESGEMDGESSCSGQQQLESGGVTGHSHTAHCCLELRRKEEESLSRGRMGPREGEGERG